jgi:ATP-dependent Clp protease ATP-binding subunit ClpA
MKPFKTKLNDEMLYKLKNTLSSINAVVDDAEQRQIQNFRVKNWLHRVQDVVFDAEDVLERIEFHYLRRKLEAESQSSTSKVLNLFNTSLSSFDKKIGENVQEILQKLSLLLTQKDILHLNSNPIERSINKSPSTFLPREPLYGRDVDISRIFDWLKRVTKDKLSMFSLVEWGIGKTALAQNLYNDPRIMRIFDLWLGFMSRMSLIFVG